MMVKTGDRIRVDGAEATVTARHAAGKHTRYTLSDGRVMHDLQKRDDVEVLAGKAPALREKKDARVFSVPTVEVEMPKLDEDRKVVLGGGHGLMRPQPTGTVEDVRSETSNGEDLLD